MKKTVIFKADGYEELSCLGNTWQPFSKTREWVFTIGEKSSIVSKEVSLSDLKMGYCKLSNAFWMDWDNTTDVYQIDDNTAVVKGELYSRISNY